MAIQTISLCILTELRSNVAFVAYIHVSQKMGSPAYVDMIIACVAPVHDEVNVHEG